jgi:hypothetical protein
MRLAAVLWLIGWGIIGLPWRGATYPPPMRRVAVVPFRDGRNNPVAHALNVALFVPAGVIGTGLGWPAAGVVAAGAVVSGATEFSQLFTTRRVASSTDLILNTTGTALGVALARRRRRRSVMTATGG